MNVKCKHFYIEKENVIGKCSCKICLEARWLLLYDITVSGTFFVNLIMNAMTVENCIFI